MENLTDQQKESLNYIKNLITLYPQVAPIIEENTKQLQKALLDNKKLLECVGEHSKNMAELCKCLRKINFQDEEILNILKKDIQNLKY